MTSEAGAARAPLPEQWSQYCAEPFAVQGLTDDAPHDEGDWAGLDAAIAGYIARAVGNGRLMSEKRQELQRLHAELVAWLPELTSTAGLPQMNRLSALAELALVYER